jgi:deoxyribose-phosphate aldolase
MAMLELGYIKDKSERRRAVRLLDEAGVPWVKNSSGWGAGSEAASPENIRLIRETVRQARVKASGKINTYEKAIALLQAGAELLGTSSGPAIMQMAQGDENGYLLPNVTSTGMPGISFPCGFVIDNSMA